MLLCAPAAFAQPAVRAAGKPPIQASSTSQFEYHVDKDQAEVVAINNVEYELTGNGIPGRKLDEILVLRKTVRIDRVVTDIGQEAKTTVEAWPLGVNLKQAPLYTTTADGLEPRVVNSDLVSILRGVEEVPWWSLYQLGTGKRLFDTYAPLVQFSISRDIQKLRYRCNWCKREWPVFYTNSIPPMCCARKFGRSRRVKFCLEPAYLAPLFRSVGRPQPSGRAKLTDRDKAVLRYILRGLTNREIGERIEVSEGAVQSLAAAAIRQAESANAGAISEGGAGAIPRSTVTYTHHAAAGCCRITIPFRNSAAFDSPSSGDSRLSSCSMDST